MGCFKFPIIHFPPVHGLWGSQWNHSASRVKVQCIKEVLQEKLLVILVIQRETFTVVLNFTTGKCCKSISAVKTGYRLLFKPSPNISNLFKLVLLWRVCSRGSAQKLDEASGCMYLAARCKISQRLKSAELWPPTLRHGASSFSHFTVLLSTDSLTACMVAQKPKTHLLPALCFWAAAAPQRGRRAARVTEAFQECKK